MPQLTEQQQLAVDSIDRNILVSAGAGSGKTHVLVERYIEILRRNPDLSVANLVAVTFTRKAAGEMRMRLKLRFQELAGHSSTNGNERWLQCLREIDGARIGTIHSLSESILKSFPSEAGIDPRFEVLDDLEQAELLEESIEGAFRQVVESQSPERRLMLDYPPDNIRQWLAGALKSSLQFREARETIGSCDDERLALLAARTLRRAQVLALTQVCQDVVWKDALDYLESHQFGDAKNKLEQYRLEVMEHARFLQSRISHLNDCDDTECQEMWERLRAISLVKPGTAGGSKEEAKSLRASIRCLRESAAARVSTCPTAPNDNDRKTFEQVRCFIGLYQRALALYDASKRSRFKLDFNDLISRAVTTLEAPNSPAKHYYNRLIAAILVDEFQDTNIIQSGLISLLSGKDTRLFLIGDDKQSIYRFQGADISTFNKWKKSLLEADARSLLSLNQSFRSHGKVVRFINAVFSRLMNDSGAQSFRARFEPLSADRQDETDRQHIEVVVYDATDAEGRRQREESSLLEGKAVASWILQKIATSAPIVDKGEKGARPIEFGDFAVLVQRNQDFAPIEAALAQAGVPYVTSGGKGFLDRQEVYDIENLLLFLACPQDSHSLLGVLRSPMFALADDLIHEIAEPRPGSLWSALRDYAESKRPGREPVARAVQMLNQMIVDAGTTPVGDLLRKAITITGYDLVLMRATNGRRRSRNLWKLVSLASSKEQLSCREFAVSLRRMRRLGVKQSDAPLNARGCVKLMTIHGAKGLEFPAVVLPVLGVPARSKKDRLLYHREYGIVFNTAREDGEDRPSYYDAACVIDSEMEYAEKKRLLYVAMTRARDYLAVFLEKEAPERASFRQWLKSVLGLDALVDAENGGTCTTVSSPADYELSFLDRSQVENGARAVRELSVAGGRQDCAAGNGKHVFDLLEPVLPVNMPVPHFSGAGARITPVNDPLNKKNEPLPADVGTFFHSLMEHLVVDLVRPSSKTIREAAIAQGDRVAHPVVLSKLIAEGERLVDRFFSSELFALLKGSVHRLPELPYLLAERSGAKIRRPDLIFQNQSGQWHLIDYKTDRIELDEIEHQAKLHRHQLKEYVHELNMLLGFSLKPFVYFAQLGMLYPLSDTFLSADS